MGQKELTVFLETFSSIRCTVNGTRWPLGVLNWRLNAQSIQSKRELAEETPRWQRK